MAEVTEQISCCCREVNAMLNFWCSVCFVFFVCALWGTVERKGIPLTAASVEGVVVLCSPAGPLGSFSFGIILGVISVSYLSRVCFK